VQVSYFGFSKPQSLISGPLFQGKQTPHTSENCNYGASIDDEKGLTIQLNGI
jgi:hypothetical protein